MKFSNEDAFQIEMEEIDYQFLYEESIKNICNSHGIEAALLYNIIEEDKLSILAYYNISISPLMGAKNLTLSNFLNKCFDQHSKPHQHKIDDDLKKILLKTSGLNVSYLILLPILYNKHKYLFLGFIKSKIEIVLKDLCYNLRQIFISYDSLFDSAMQLQKLSILENYVKEVGHDIASAVQATLAKLKNVSRKIITGDFAIKKIIEAEKEIMSAYRIAEGLGFTVNPNYNISNGNYFNIVDSTKNVISHYESEAQEGHNDIILEVNHEKIETWGDSKGIELAVGQYLYNAIKYSFGSTNIYVKLESTQNDIFVTVTNKGILIDKDEFSKIWEFGYRGQNAKERHVNGAGIGLYTVKKIITSHGGNVKVFTDEGKKNVTFSFSIPKDIMKKTELLKPQYI